MSERTVFFGTKGEYLHSEAGRIFTETGGGENHVAFGAMAIAVVLNISNDMPLVMIITVVCAVLLIRTGQNAKNKGDASAAMISVGSTIVTVQIIVFVLSYFSGLICGGVRK